MKYMLLIYNNEAVAEELAQLGKIDFQTEIDLYQTYTKALIDAGVFVDVNSLQPSATGTNIRISEGDRVITHGPYAETKEQLGGYYVIDCGNLDEALDWAAQCPGIRNGQIEVRPLVDLKFD